MIDISDKSTVKRTAIATGTIALGERSLRAIEEGSVRKGEVFQSARIAAIQAVKATPQLLAFCHPLPVEAVEVQFERSSGRIRCTCTVTAHYRTGVEMEALMGVSNALLTIWDMVKYLEKDEEGQYPGTSISGIRVLSKTKEG